MANSISGSVNTNAKIVASFESDIANLLQNINGIPPGVAWAVVNGDDFGKANDIYLAQLTITEPTPVTINFFDDVLLNPNNETIGWKNLKALIISLPPVVTPIIQADGLTVGGGTDSIIPVFERFFPSGGVSYVDLTGLLVDADNDNLLIDGTGNAHTVVVDILAIGTKS